MHHTEFFELEIEKRAAEAIYIQTIDTDIYNSFDIIYDGDQ